MTENVELLNYIYQNSEMGIETIPQLLQIVEIKNMHHALETQLEEYKLIHYTAKKYLESENQDAKGINGMVKLSSYLMTNFKTLTDKSTSHIAEMMIQGSTMGIIEITRNLNQYKEVKDDYKNLAEQLLVTEESNIEEMKLYL